MVTAGSPEMLTLRQIDTEDDRTIRLLEDCESGKAYGVVLPAGVPEPGADHAFTIVTDAGRPALIVDWTPDLGAMEAELAARIAALRDRRPALALDALSSDQAKTEFEQVEAEILEAETELRRVRLAREGQSRQAEIARAEGLAERRRAALDKARDLRERRQKKARQADHDCGRYVAALAEWMELAADEQRALDEAGLHEAAHAARASSEAVIAGLKRAVRDAGPALGRVYTDLAHVEIDRQVPLAEGDVKFDIPLALSAELDGSTDA